jgi:hypothetical protein
MNYGIKKVLKEKKVKDKKIEMVELFGNNLFAILIFDENDNLIDSECNCTFDDIKMARKMTNQHYRKKLKNLQNF